MKTNQLAILVPLLLVAARLMADPSTNGPSAIPLPPDASVSYWILAISAVTPVVIALIRFLAPRIPKPWIPALTPVVGLLLNWVSGLYGAGEVSPLQAAIAGAAGVAIRELIKQLRTLSVEGGTTAMLLLALGGTFSAGCTSYRHERWDPESGKPIELTSVHAPWLTKTAIEGIKSKTTDKRGTNIYSRTLGIDSANAQTDVEGVNALRGLLGDVLIQALSKTAPVPVK